VIGRSGFTAFMFIAGVLPAAQVDEIRREAEREQQIAKLVSVTAWSWSKAHDVLTEGACLGIAVADLIAEAGRRGPDGVLALVAHARAQVPELSIGGVREAVEQLQRANPQQDEYKLPVFVESAEAPDLPVTMHSFRVGDQLARRLRGRR